MKRLIVFRHAKSSWSEPGKPDNERPLSSRGERDAPAMGARLAARGERPEVILSSHAGRAKATARAVAAALKSPATLIRIERRLYLASLEQLLDVLREQDDDESRALLVGHNPGLTELVNYLLPTLALDNLPTAGVVAIDVDAEHWSDLRPAVCRLLYYDYPKNTAR